MVNLEKLIERTQTGFGITEGGKEKHDPGGLNV